MAARIGDVAMTTKEKNRRARENRRARLAALPKIPCECGCGVMISSVNSTLKPARFHVGHNPGHKAFRERYGRGRSMDPNGYVRVLTGVTLASGHASYQLEHRVVMAQAIGRPLEPWETVHHINGIRDDNRLENLQLRQGSHGKGSAYRCCECGSHNVEATQLPDSESGQIRLMVREG